MSYDAKILADSVNPGGNRLTTFEVTFPRIVLAEFNTHREFSRNSASSRAIPVQKQIDRLQLDPFIPIYWGKNQKGMQAEEELTKAEQEEAERDWLAARDLAIGKAQALLRRGVHKQITNRLLEPWMWHTVIVSATQWENFFALRCHRDAQPEIRKIAEMMRDLYRSNEPTKRGTGDWHLPLVTLEERKLLADPKDRFRLQKICVGRCTRVSYLTHDGRRDPEEDIALCDRIAKAGHMSPFEHAAYPLMTDDRVGNFVGWNQYRKFYKNEAVFQAEKLPET